MKHSTAFELILQRLLSQYGPVLRTVDLAAELKTTAGALYSRRARGTAGTLPEPVPGVWPRLYRAVDLATWMSGETTTSSIDRDSRSPVKRRPGRPRKLDNGAA